MHMRACAFRSKFFASFPTTQSLLKAILNNFPRFVFLKAKNCGGCPHSTSFFKLMEKRVQNLTSQGLLFSFYDSVDTIFGTCQNDQSGLIGRRKVTVYGDRRMPMKINL
jgi:hypothetical protein